MHAFDEQPTNTDTELELHHMQRPKDHQHFPRLKIKVKTKQNNHNEHLWGQTAAPLGTLPTSELMIGVDMELMLADAS